MRQNLSLCVTMTLLSSMFYALQGGAIKWAGHMDAYLLLFYQYMFALIAFVFARRLTLKKMAGFLESPQIKRHIFRAFFGFLATLSVFVSLKYTSLVDTILLLNASPFLVPFIGFLLYKLPINHKAWIPILIGFCGVSVVLHPDGKVLSLVNFIPLLGAFAMATALLSIHRLSHTESDDNIIFIYLVFSTLFSACFLPQHFAWLSIKEIATAAIVGLLFFGAQVTGTLAVSKGNALLVSTLYYANVIMSAVISCVFFHVPFTWHLFSGMALTIVGGLLTIRAQHRFDQDKRVSPAAVAIYDETVTH